jgi:hypothetical protein
MKQFGLKFIAAFACLTAFGVLAADTVTSSDTGVKFPTVESFSYDGVDYELTVTGIATRKKFFVRIYSVASYLQKNGNGAEGDKYRRIMNPEKAKQLTLKWVRNVDGASVENGYRESLAKTDAAGMSEQINAFVSFFKDGVEYLDEHQIRWIPGGTIEVLINGSRAGTIENEAFAKGLWQVWFGPDSVVDRENLTTMMQ